MIRLTEHLNKSDLQALSQLVKRCKKEDGHRIAFYPELLANKRPKPSSVLLFHQNQLIGFAAAFFFELDCAEITLLIHPAHRRRHFSKACLRPLLHEIARFRPVSKLSFSTPHHLWTTALKEQGLTYLHTEYEMKYGGHEAPLNLDSLVIRRASFDDMQALCNLDQRCFPSTHAYSEARFHTLLQREKHVIFVLLKNNTIIGKAHVSWDEKTAFLSDIAVLPEKQHQGFGTKLIAYCVQFADTIPQRNIRLSVEAYNNHALKLYLHLGFKNINAIDYWECLFSTFEAHLETFRWFQDNDKT